MGQWAYNGLPCKVYPAEDSELAPGVQKEVVAP
jgi:hypothetical protein